LLLRRYGWPPNSPDLNPVYYAIWGALQERVYYGRKFENVEQLKKAILLELRALLQRFIDGSINQWGVAILVLPYKTSWQYSDGNKAICKQTGNIARPLCDSTAVTEFRVPSAAWSGSAISGSAGSCC